MTGHAPLTSADADLQDFPFMPLHVARLRDSDLAAEAHPEACWYAVLLWSASWHQVPAGSLPAGEAVLARLCGLGRDVKTFRRHRDDAMRGWIECSDGRLYHPVVAEQVNSAWSEKLAYRDRKAKRAASGSAGGEAKWNADPSGLSRSQRLSIAREKGRHTKQDWLLMIEACGTICARCGDGGPLVKDHILPIYKGGSDGIENLQPLCPTCNSSKGPEDTDHRPNGWEDRYERLRECLANGKRTPSKMPDEIEGERLPKGTGRGKGTGSYSDADASGGAAAVGAEVIPIIPAGAPPSPPVDPAKVMFDSGIALLGAAAVPERKARSMLGKWLRDHGPETVIVALGNAQREGAVDPVSFIERCFRNGPQSRPARQSRNGFLDAIIDEERAARA
ncbi:HNH endonuclease [Sphingomonas sp. CARO-RG-8B-R24-01]|uniref:HNH endonuclease n=1 Tax=Sphingomonas sp. CARO-RG-8B-R24-01 TaxID=2914831 RepID=UPI001F574CF3|nr:HNH endonuclease [Sphingomonas sp. CARO-RG-8B-R24-01]